MDSSSSNLLLLLFNALLWTVTLLYFWSKARYFSLGISILLFYTIIAVVDVHLFFSETYSRLFNDLQLFPFIYLYAMILLIITPILKIKENRIIQIYKPETPFFKFVVIFLILISFYGVWNIIVELPRGLMMLMVDSDYGKEAYQDGLSNLDRARTGGISIINIGCNAARAVVPAFLIYYITSQKTNKFILVGLIIASLLGPLEAISKGSRLDPAVFVLNLLFLYIFIRNFLPNKIKSKIKVFAFAILILICVPFFVVTVSRSNGDIERSLYSIERYTAESFINFNNYGLNANGIRYGDKTFPAFKEIIGLETARTYVDRRYKYSKMYMDESVFYTFVGDFTLDFGPVLTVVLFLFTTALFGYFLKIRNGALQFYQYLCVYLLMYGCVGFFQFPLADINGNMRILLLLFLIFCFKLEYDLKRKV